MRRRPGGAARLATLAVLLPLGLTAALAVAAPVASATTDRAATTRTTLDARTALEPRTAPAGTGLPLEVTLTSITPQVLQPGDDLTLTATVRNTGPTAVAEPRAVVHLDRGSFISRSSLDRWRTADVLDDAGRSVLTVDLTGPLAPGASATWSVTVPASSVGLPSRLSSWGPRALALELVDRADPARVRLGLARSFALWFPEQEVTATRVSVLVPVVGPAVDPHTQTWIGDLAALTGPSGRLTAVLAATQDHPEVGWVVDPWLAEVGGSDGAARTEADDTKPDDTEADDTEAPAAPRSQATPDSRAWFRALSAATTDRDVMLLPYGDADVTALAHARSGEVLAAAFDRGRDAARAGGLPDGADASVVWPADALPDLTTAAFVNERETRAVVVGPGQLPPPSVLTYTPTGRATATTAGGEVTLLLADDRLSAALTTGFVRSDLDRLSPASAVQDPLSPATAAQDLLAELAVITRERPSDGRHLLATVPRDWNPDPVVASAQLAALDAAPWVHTESVSALVGAPDTGVDRGTLPTREVDRREVSAGEIDTVRTAVADRRSLARMVQDPAGLLEDLDAEVLAAVSAAWRADPAGRAAAIAESTAINDRLRSAVSVPPGLVVNLVSTSGDLPVRVSNSLDQPVTVLVGLEPGDVRLVADDAVEVTIPAQGAEDVAIPVHAIQSADLQVRVEVRTPDGLLVDDRTVLMVRVRADWEGIGTAVIGALLAVGMVIGVIRTIRRGRTGRRAAPVDSGPDALSPEEDP